MNRLADARQLIETCQWSRAVEELESLELADDRSEADRLDLLADGRWWLSQLDACIEARRGAYERYHRCGDTRRAAQTAVWLYEHHCFAGQPSIGNGWLQRARQLLDGDAECAPWGNLVLREAEQAHGRGDLADAEAAARRALDLARRLGDASLEGEALQTLGRILIDARRPIDGFAVLDEAMLLAIEGRLSPYATGKVYCSMVGACADVGDLRRAAEWTDATSRWADDHPFAVFPGLCRVKRAEVLHWRGDYALAEAEARRACDELSTMKVGTAGAAWTEVGEIRRRIGDLDGAEEAFERAVEMCCTPSAGLSLLRLATGRVEEATSVIDDALREARWSPVEQARLLPAKVEIAVAVGDVPGARAAAERLEELADLYATASLGAAAALARGRVALSTGDAGEASTHLRRAAQRWRELEVPYEQATAHCLLSYALEALGDSDGAARARESAMVLFDRLGARYDARWADARHAPKPPAGLTEREVEVLRLVAVGLTNKAIAGELVLSTKTVARHLSNIFTKTGVSTRSAATAFAFEHGLTGTNRST